MPANGGIIGPINVPVFTGASGVWDLKTAQTFQSIGSWPSSGIDPFTTLMLHMDGSNGGTTFTDSSASGLSITPAGVTTSTTTPQFGTASALFAASGAGLSFSPGTALSFAGDFTIDFWMKTNVITTDGAAFRRMIAFNTDSATGIQFYLDASGFVVIRNNTTLLQGNVAVNTNNWTHIALTRSGTDLKQWVNGAQSGSTVSNSTSFAPGATARIGSYDGSVGRYSGNIDEFRVSKGIARWNAAFTPPGSAYA